MIFINPFHKKSANVYNMGSKSNCEAIRRSTAKPTQCDSVSKETVEPERLMQRQEGTRVHVRIVYVQLKRLRDCRQEAEGMNSKQKRSEMEN